jgi:membrane-bound serine protease (ClpP class)
MKRHCLVFALVSMVLAPGLFLTSARAAERYALIKLEGSVNPIIAEHVADSIKKAGEQKAQFVVIQLDTPGGLLTSMREIIKAILGSEIPVVVYTFPRGAQAASAGGYIMLSAHVAAMAPGTEIGAMHPVSPFIDFSQKEGPGENIMGKKVLNDTIAYGKSLAQKRGRNVDWTVRAIKDAISSTYLEAYRYGVIDVIADDMDQLFRKIDGKRVDVNGRIVTLRTKGIGVLSFEMDWKKRMLNFFADPQMAFLLFIIAVIGIGMEFKSPGLIVPGVIGALALFMFLMAVRVLPVNLAGLALIVLAIALFILELKVASYGLLTIGGIISFVFGSMILFDSPLPGGQVPMTSIIAVVVVLMLFFFVVVRAVIRVHRGKVTTGAQGMIGENGTAITGFQKTGTVRVHGEIWKARSDDPIGKGDPVTVVGINGMQLIVKKGEDA